MTYQEARQQLRAAASHAKRMTPNDKPAIRQAINDTCDLLSREINLRETSEAKARQQIEWLSLYACQLHPKEGGLK